MRWARWLLPLLTSASLVACGSSSGGAPGGAGGGSASGGGVQAHPQAVEPQAGAMNPQQDPAASGGAPVGDPNAHAPSLAEVRAELKTEQKIAKELNALSPGQGFVF